ncbi:MAG: amidophosphoribosyltransferase [Thermoproteota archaeon]|nr:amidophosphoribosyltransferase [Thermoproteota archaeon]
MKDCLKIACGVFGAINFERRPIFSHIYWGLRVQNHRGHQSHGFVTYDGNFHVHKSLDLVPKIKREEVQSWLKRMPGYIGVGSIRYTTSGGTNGGSLKKGIQPAFAEAGKFKVAVSFNGNVVNTSQMKREIQETFPEFRYECDAELICRKLLIELKKSEDLTSSVKTCMKEIEGAFSVAGITQKGDFFAFKDPHGIRPLCAGCSENRKTCAFSSETVGLDINNLEYNFEIAPGELVVASENGLKREQLITEKKRSFCAFEFAYFARPDSKLNGKYVYEVREEFGRNLAREYSDVVKNGDIVISIPQTGDDAAWGLHEETGIRWERALRRHRFVTERAFILLPKERYATLDRKINILGPKLKGKNVLVVDDSIVRGDTMRTIVDRVRKAGAKKVHLFITFPRIISPCFYGIDMATYGELIGSTHDADEIAELLGADGVHYQSIDNFVRATGMRKNELCLACLTRKYPTPLAQKLADEMWKRFEKGYKENARIYEAADVLERTV